MATSLQEIAVLFLKLGTIAFGGPAAHIAMMEAEVVRKKKWLTHPEFLDLLGATNLIPGPNSTELAIHIGHRQAGFSGLLVAGACFIFPAVLIVLMLAWLYVAYGNLPEMSSILYGIKPVMIAIIFQALWNLGKNALKTRLLFVLAVLAAMLNFIGLNELVVLFGVGIYMVLKQWFSQKHRPDLKGITFLPAALMAQATPAAITTPIGFGLWPLFLIFLKIGAVLFGSGYVLLAFLRADLVQHYHWISQQQLLDAVAVGQITPGPVFTTATFIGYVLGGWPGAWIATLGIFLPAFFFVAVSGPFVPRLRESQLAGAFLDGVNASAVSLMLVVTLQLAGASFVDPATMLLGIGSICLLLFTRINSTWLILAGGLTGFLLKIT